MASTEESEPSTSSPTSSTSEIKTRKPICVILLGDFEEEGIYC
jgi:hypothetical protein